MAQLAVSSAHQLRPGPHTKRRRLSDVLDKLCFDRLQDGCHEPPIVPAPQLIQSRQAAPPLRVWCRLVSPPMFAPAEADAPPGSDEPCATAAPLAVAAARSQRTLTSDVFRFDGLDREPIAYRAISEEDEDVFSPVPSRSPQSSLDSPLVNQSSPRAGFSPLRVKEEGDVDVKLETHAHISPPRLHVVSCERGGGGGGDGGAHRQPPHRLSLCACAQCTSSGDTDGRQEMAGRLVGGSPLSPLTPVSPAASSSLSQSPLPLEYLTQLSELYRRRSHSDSDLSAWLEQPAAAAAARSSVLRQGWRAAPQPLHIPGKSGSLESDQSSPQDSPLDLSLRSGGRLAGVSSPSALPSWETAALALAPHPLTGLRAGRLRPAVSIVRGDVASPTTRDSVALRYNLEVCPVVEEMPPGTDVAYVCPVCGQMFSLHDRLAKHMASRHKSKPVDPASKAYVCETCKRSFARSDMLTRHMRLHTGLKPYTCRACGQVFSRSDHLSTHQRTHTGEKPYKCPQCPYAACRRDMITRHMRTHARYELGDGGGGSVDEAVPPRSPRGPPRRANSEEQPPTYLRHLSAGLGIGQEAPPSPSVALQSLSVQSPSPMETEDSPGGD